jgi:hypothetical protein
MEINFNLLPIISDAPQRRQFPKASPKTTFI